MDLPAHDLREYLFAVNNRAVLPLPSQGADVACAARRLCARQLRDNVVGAFPTGRFAGLFIRAHQRRQVMTQCMTRERVALPSSVDRSLGGKTRVLHEVVQQTVPARSEEKSAIDVDR